MKNKLMIYQNKSGAIELKSDIAKETVWANLQQIADLFSTDKSGISRHIKNIFKTEELLPDSTVAVFATVQNEGARSIKRDIEYYNLDVIISVGYRVNSQEATKFRQWATKTLRQYIQDGYTINKKQVAKNYNSFLKAVDDVKKLLPPGTQVKTEDVLELIQLFAATWFSLDAYDKSNFPEKGVTKRKLNITAKQLNSALAQLKTDLISKNQATDFFAREKQENALEGIIGNVFQSFGGEDVYPTLEEKAAHLLYFIIKNHPFVDGNKRSGAFSFVWFLRKAKLLNNERISPEALTTLTLLIAESQPTEKQRMIGLVLILLKKQEK